MSRMSRRFDSVAQKRSIDGRTDKGLGSRHCVKWRGAPSQAEADRLMKRVVWGGISKKLVE